MDQLDEDHREVIYLARIHLLPLKEVGKRMGRSADAVSELLRRALRQLKEIFGDTDSFGLPPKNLADPPRGGGDRFVSPARKGSPNGTQSGNGAAKGS